MENLKGCLLDNSDIYIGKVNYEVKFNKNEIEIPEKPSTESFLYSPYFYKRKPFKYEQEVRAIIDVLSILSNSPYESGKHLKIDVNTLIGKNNEVIVSPHADELIAGTLELIVKQFGFKFYVNRSKLLDLPD